MLAGTYVQVHVVQHNALAARHIHTAQLKEFVFLLFDCLFQAWRFAVCHEVRKAPA